MECRTLLTIPIPRPAAPNAAGNTRSSVGSPLRSRWSDHRSVGRQGAPGRGHGRGDNLPAQIEKKRLPLPKNVVLLSLMEATEVATEMEHRSREPSLVSQMESFLSENAGEDDDDEEEKIKVSTSLTIGACGTYVVADKDGLQIYPSRPTTLNLPDLNRDDKTTSSDRTTVSDDDVDTLVRFFHLDHKVGVDAANGDLKTLSEEDTELKYGDRVQIVSLHEGWAKLARGYGYIRADANKLVKGKNCEIDFCMCA